MKKKGQLRKRLLCALLAAVLGIGLALTGYVPVAEAAGNTTEMANLVILARMQGNGENTLADR